MRNKQTQMPAAGKGSTTLISAGTTVSGDITFSGNLDIEGGSLVRSVLSLVRLRCCESLQAAQ